MAKEPGHSVAAEGGVDLDALFRRNYGKVMNYFLRVGIPTREEAADLAQETFLRAFRGRAGFRGDSSEDTWVYEIARNIFKNWIRDRNALKHRGIEVPLDPPPEQEEELPGLDLEDPDPLPLELVMTAERRERLLEAVKDLPASRQMCVRLRLKDLAYEEIAAIMAVSVETVKSHLYQAREALRKVLSDLGRN